MPLTQVDGSLIAPVVQILSGGIRIGGSIQQPSQQTTPAVTTYFYRVIATGVRATTTSLTSIPAGAVIEGITTT